MDTMVGRFSRQIRLTEVGEAGQLAIQSARTSVEVDDVSGEAEVLYLAGAGVGILEVPTDSLATKARRVHAQVQVQVRPIPREPSAALPDSPHLLQVQNHDLKPPRSKGSQSMEDSLTMPGSDTQQRGAFPLQGYDWSDSTAQSFAHGAYNALCFLRSRLSLR